jgi:hypothetical protein
LHLEVDELIGEEQLLDLAGEVQGWRSGGAVREVDRR